LILLEQKNLFAALPCDASGENVSELISAPNVRIERIVSIAHASPPGFWYDQDLAEWVAVLKGSAGVMFEGESAPRTLQAGDYLCIPAHRRHRVEWTQANGPTVWLAVHFSTDDGRQRSDDRGQMTEDKT